MLQFMKQVGVVRGLAGPADSRQCNRNAVYFRLVPVCRLYSLYD
jgi:hypothetical protein